MEIPCAACLPTCALQPLAAEGLHADHGADLVAVDVDVADASTSGDALHRRIDAAVDAEGQAIAGPVDRVHDTVDAVAVEARDVEDRPEDLPFQLGDGIDLEGARREERSEEHTSELQSLMRISSAVFCLLKKHIKEM